MPRRHLPRHTDAGLQPERTTLAWGRTMMAMVVASLVFLRWIPHHGWFAGILVVLALLTALGIYVSQRVRYRRGVHGISRGRIHADAVAVFSTAAAVAVLGALGIYTVLVLPLNAP